MRLAHSLPLLLVAACGDSGTTSASASATDSATGSTGASDPSTGTPTTTGDTPTGGSGGATDSGTTTSPSTSTSTSATTSETGDTGGSTMSLQTDPLPDTTTTAPATTSTAPDTTSTTAETSSSETTADTTGGIEPCACSDDIEVPIDDGIFVLGDTGDLWKYFPKDNMFTLLGELGCDLPPATFSMAVDRLGYAWVEYPSGALRKIAVTDLTDCTDPGYPIGQQGILNFGMAFVSNSAFDKCDRIYGSEYSGFPMNDFFDIDPDTLQLTKIGATPSAVSEVTGTGDGRAFLFSSTFPPTLVEVDKETGMVLSTTPLPQINIGSGLAFAFFAGDFYFFTDGQNDFSSEVTHMDYDDSDMNGQQDIVQVFNNAPLRILGAGVSTCVPTFPQ